MSAIEPPSPSGYNLHNKPDNETSELLWDLLNEPVDTSPEALQKHIVRHAAFSLARTKFNLDKFALYQAAALSVRDVLIERWNETQIHHTTQDVKRVYYMSMEFLVGRSLQNAVLNLDLDENLHEALFGLGCQLEDLYEEEKDAALGNGGLGRLAACFLDSMATLDLPAWGYGIRYRYGIFKQVINEDGSQGEQADFWLNFGNPWEIPRLDVSYPIHFYGSVVTDPDTGATTWTPGITVRAVAYDYPVCGFKTPSCINMRLWSATPAKGAEFDLERFSKGEYMSSIEEKRSAEDISSVLYPNDNNLAGKVLRLKQEYFFSSATIQDVLRRFLKRDREWEELPDKVAIQLNDTHPTISIIELLRILIDEHGLEFDRAWGIVKQCFHYTNHTLLVEALERLPIDMLEELLPRHMELIYEVNYRFLQEVEAWRPNDRDLLRRMSMIDEQHPRTVRMAHLAIVGSAHCNGVAALHTSLLRSNLFFDFAAFYGSERFINKTNGITPRRWLNQANRPLAQLITTWLESDEWLINLDALQGLRDLVSNPELQTEWVAAKQTAKQRLADLIEERMGLTVSTDALFDIQVKRIHEYKRQLLNALSVVHRYQRILAAQDDPAALEAIVPRVVVFAGKAAPGYHMAKCVIRLINAIARVINTDRRVGDRLKVVFIPDYNVSLAEVIIPASDLSQHISTAGMEASGTSNMKFALNGGLIIGTMDGANIEIAEEIGKENMFIFGALADEVEEVRHQVQYRTPTKSKADKRLADVIRMIRSGVFGSHPEFEQVLHSIEGRNDRYLVKYDWASYLDAQDRVDVAFKDTKAWTKMSILSTAGMGFFSSDRTISQYAAEIWGVEAARPGQ